MQNERLVQLYPSSITITNRRNPTPFYNAKFDDNPRNRAYKKGSKVVENFLVKKNPFVISKSSKKKMLRSINSMYMLSVPRTIAMKNKKFIYNYRMSFITLTLPSKQQHSDVEIKKRCLNQFLVELRKAYGIKNYLWKAELQKNNNIHFHLLVDQYIDFQALRRRWNRILNKLEYVDHYRTRMAAMSLSEYHTMRCKYGKQDFSNSAAAYAAGNKSNWSNPNTVDVKSVYSKNELAIYLSKYICKNAAADGISETEKTRQLAFGRAWFRSYSLSSLKYQHKYLESEVVQVIKYLRSVKDKVLEIQGEFFTAFYFSAEQLSAAFQKFHKFFIFKNAEIHDYPLPYPI